MTIIGTSSYHVLEEEQKKGRVHRIELWDKAHMKKDGRYANRNVQIVMVFFHIICIESKIIFVT